MVAWPGGLRNRSGKALNILTIQAEDDGGELAEMAAGVIQGMELGEAEIEEVNKRTTYVQWFANGDVFLAKLRDALCAEREAGRPVDLVRINPLHSFAGGDLVRPETVATFCRSGLNQIAHDFNCGILVVHHTPKINLTARPVWTAPSGSTRRLGARTVQWARAHPRHR
jgi:RecA-family ATPase